MKTIHALSTLIGLYSLQAEAAFYVSPSGKDSNPGTMAQPFASVMQAQTAATAGDTVWIRGGTYGFTAGTNTCGGSQTATVNVVVLSKSGAKGLPIRYWAYPGETPVFDFVGVKDDCRIKGFDVTGNWIHLKGLEIEHVKQHNNLNHESWGVWVSGSFNTFELLNMHHNMGPGLFIQKGAGNLGLNCDSHHNRDSLTSNGDGQSADGFGVHVSAGDTGNVLRGCRAWMNTDDGYDLINAFDVVTIEHCLAAYSGYIPGTTTSLSAGNGNGFKAGGYGADATLIPANPPKHRILYNFAFDCKANNFYANHHPVNCIFYNNTAYGTHVNFDMLGLKADGTTAGVAITVGTYRNNIAYGGTAIADNKNNTSDDVNNSWNMSSAPAGSDFTGVDTAGAFGPRKADGSIPDFKFMHLAAGSKYIAAGVDVGFGAKPDMGAFPYGTTNLVAETFGREGRNWRIERGAEGALDLVTDLPESVNLRVEVADAAGRVEMFSVPVSSGSRRTLLRTAMASRGIRMVRIEGPGFSESAKVMVR
jgi:hypothetical protein